jgi:hypothetical protein
VSRIDVNVSFPSEKTSGRTTARLRMLVSRRFVLNPNPSASDTIRVKPPGNLEFIK